MAKPADLNDDDDFQFESTSTDVVEQVRRLLNERKESLGEKIADGGADSFPRYQHLVGRRKEAKFLEQQINALVKKLRRTEII